jgi:phenylacetic acid degradation operon negative regulatory protein
MTDSELLFALLVSLPVKELTINQLRRLSRPFGITDSNIRSVLSRLHEKDMIAIRKDGRTAHYRLGARGSRIGANISLHFHEPDWSVWDGKYWGAAFTIPDSRTRYRIQKKLASYRFRVFYPGLWIRPRNPGESVMEAFAEFIDSSGFDLFSIRFDPKPSAERISALFELERVLGVIEKALTRTKESLEKAAGYSPSEAFYEQMILGNELVHALAEDPLLPPELLPDHWPAPQFRALFKSWNRVYSELGGPFIRDALKEEPL